MYKYVIALSLKYIIRDIFLYIIYIYISLYIVRASASFGLRVSV